MRRSDGARRRRPPRSVSPGRWGACGGRPHGRVDGDRVSRVMGGVLRSTREEGARLRVPPRGRGAGDDQMVLTAVLLRVSAPAPGGVGRSRRGRPAGRDPALAPVRAARSGCRCRRTIRHPGSSPVRAARSGCRCRRTVRHPGSSPVRAARPARPRGRSGWGDPGRGLPRPRRRGPSRPGPRPDRESLRPPPSQSELQPLPGGSLTGTATAPGDAPRRPPIHEIAGQPTSSSTSWSTCSTPIREIAG